MKNEKLVLCFNLKLFRGVLLRGHINLTRAPQSLTPSRLPVAPAMRRW